MRKNVLALSIATMIGGLGFAGVASADVIVGSGTPSATNLGLTTAASFTQPAVGGTGHILIVPYFTAQNGNGTVVHLVNTDSSNGKVVKIRFRSAANSDDILDFQILLSPSDVWTGVVTAEGAGGVARISTGDNSCTYPKLEANVPQPFVTDRLDQKAGAANIANATREGYIEIFNTADIPSASVYGTGSARSALYTATKHVNGVPPCTDSVFQTALLTNQTSEPVAAAQGFATPTGGLLGDWYIINIPDTTTYSGASTAIQAVTAGGASARGNFVVFPQNAGAVSNTENFSADPLLSSVLFPAGVGTSKTAAGVTSGQPTTTLPIVQGANYDLPDLSTPYYAAATSTNALAQAGVLTTALAVTSVTNEYANDASITARTDWVFSMPTRRYSVAVDYKPTAQQRIFSPGITGGGVAYFHASNTVLEGNLICVSSAGQTFYDREEGTRSAGAVFSPGNVTTTRFCGEASVLSFGVPVTDSSVLSASVARQATQSAFTNGWGTISTTNGGPGLPIVGASFIKLTNPNATPGVSGTYGISFPHRSTRATVAPI